uniref:57-kDa merozoite protein n=1 Tax=Babesia gibsoni TaxID=33632 RepID=A8D039_BABGI|nr:57-kDa merozoite protein [Babesia gibsoni]
MRVTCVTLLVSLTLPFLEGAKASLFHGGAKATGKASSPGVKEISISSPSIFSSGHKSELTVYQKLLWLASLTDEHAKSLSKVFKELKEKKSINLPTDSDFEKLAKDGAKDAAILLAAIEDGFITTNGKVNNEKKEEDRIKIIKEDAKSVTHPTEEKVLFAQYVEYNKTVYEALRFLYVMCGRGEGSGGWMTCRYGRTVGSTCNVKHNKCPNCVAACKGNIPFGCLQDYLTLTFTSLAEYDNSAFYNHAYGPMGFIASKLPSDNKVGRDIQKVLDPYVKDAKSKLTKLVATLVLFEDVQHLGLSDMFTILFKLGKASMRGGSRKFVKALKLSLDNKSVNESAEPSNVVVDGLVHALRSFCDSGRHTAGNHSGKALDLHSLLGCGQTHNSCPKILYPLPFDIYNADDAQEKNAAVFASWIRDGDLVQNFKLKLHALKYNLEALDCLSPMPEHHQSGPCPNVVQCLYVPPALYDFGFGLWSPGELVTRKVNGKQLLEKITKLLTDPTSELTKLMAAVANYDASRASGGAEAGNAVTDANIGSPEVSEVES